MKNHHHLGFLIVYSLVAQQTLPTLANHVDVETTRKLSSEKLAIKIEKMLTVQGNPMIDKVKEELGKQIKYNFLKNLAAHILVQRPMKEDQEIFKLMQKTLNDELDFIPVVEKIPTLLREEDATQRFQIILNSIREKEIKEIDGAHVDLRQQQNETTTKPTQLDKIVDAASKLNIKDLSMFLKEIPEIFEGIQTIVDSVDDIFGKE